MSGPAHLPKAISVMTAWTEGVDNQDLAADVVGDIAAEDEAGVLHLSVGLANLCGILLLRVERLTGATPTDTLREIAVRYDSI